MEAGQGDQVWAEGAACAPATSRILATAGLGRWKTGQEARVEV